ncbi:MAG TPA: GNAT family N-acetyltransferase [Clostridia bacterium]|jgi:ribosomal protein S18 acetylase RimI-like enzyme|nr:GNAT family N-acetyltransferase [Clostridia bacterium]
MEYNVRKAQKKDVDDIIRLLKQIAQLHHEKRPDIFKNNANKYTQDLMYFKIKKPDEYIAVAVDDKDKVAGYIFCLFETRKNHLFMQDRKLLYIDDFCVDDDKKGTGIGSLLFEHILAYAKNEHYDAIELHVWEFNESAMHFYEKHGFTTKYRRMELLLDDKSDVNNSDNKGQ